MWVVKVGAGLSGVTHVPACSLLETSLLHGLVFWRAVSQARGCGGCVEEVVTGRGGRGSKLLLPPCLSWAEPRTFLGLSVYRKWELSALLGAGAVPSKSGVGVRWGRGAVPWGVERNESQI